ncbi:hypothetical protein WJ968_37260 [Achromobacter xylosoxidans]
MNKNKRAEELKNEIINDLVFLHEVVTDEDLEDDIKESMFKVLLCISFKRVEELNKYE